MDGKKQQPSCSSQLNHYTYTVIQIKLIMVSLHARCQQNLVSALEL